MGLPRGIPAASLKLDLIDEIKGPKVRLPRGIPAASLKQVANHVLSGPPVSSAGNTRGLIEAMSGYGDTPSYGTVFRGEYPRPH